jgi:hypothetical protein
MSNRLFLKGIITDNASSLAFQPSTNRFQLKVFNHRLKVPVVMQQKKVMMNAEGSDHYVDCLSDCRAQVIALKRIRM